MLGRSLVALSCLAASACSSAPSLQRTLPPPGGPPKKAAPEPPKGPPTLPFAKVGEVASAETPVAFAAADGSGVVAYARPGKLCAHRVKLAPDRVEPAVEACADAAEILAVSVQAAHGGFDVAWIEVADGSRQVRAAVLGADGKLGAPDTLARTADDCAWVSVLPNAKGALVAWETRSPSGTELHVAPHEPGKPAKAGATFARLPDTWDLAASPRGAALAYVTQPPQERPEKKAAPAKKGKAPPPLPDENDALGQVVLVDIDATAKASDPLVVAPGRTALSDVDVENVGGQYLLAWTDLRAIDSAVWGATVEPGGKIVRAPARLVPPTSEQALVKLVGDPKGDRALLAWEDVRLTEAESRTVRFATIEKGAARRERATLTFQGPVLPDLALDGSGGFTAVTLAPARFTGADRATVPAPDEVVLWPTFVRFGADLSIVASEPVRADAFPAPDRVPALARALGCDGGACAIMGAVDPAPPAAAPAKGAKAAPPAPSGGVLAVVGLPTRKSDWTPPARVEDTAALPSAESITSIYAGERAARVAAVRTPQGLLTAWVTVHLDGAQGEKKGDPDGATFATRLVRPDGSLGPVEVISKKASTLGGVAMAMLPGDAGKEPDVLVAWVAREKGESQVYVTKLGADGKKKDQRKLTMIGRKGGKGVTSEASEVALAATGSGADAGFVVAWIDTRDGNAEVYTARVDRTGKKQGPDRRVTEAAGEATEVVAASLGGDVLLAWSDARDPAAPGVGDLFAQRLQGRTLERKGKEIKLFTTPGHSRTPALSATQDGYLLGWVEETSADAPAQARLAELGADGQPVAQSLTLKGTQGVLSLALACAGKSCRVVLADANNDGGWLRGLTYAGHAPPEPKPLAILTGIPSRDLVPWVVGPDGASVLYGDDAVAGGGRVRHLRARW